MSRNGMFLLIYKTLLHWNQNLDTPLTSTHWEHNADQSPPLNRSGDPGSTPEIMNFQYRSRGRGNIISTRLQAKKHGANEVEFCCA
jgi:hypothetical protein